MDSLPAVSTAGIPVDYIAAAEAAHDVFIVDEP